MCTCGILAFLSVGILLAWRPIARTSSAIYRKSELPVVAVDYLLWVGKVGYYGLPARMYQAARSVLTIRLINPISSSFKPSQRLGVGLLPLLIPRLNVFCVGGSQS